MSDVRRHFHKVTMTKYTEPLLAVEQDFIARSIPTDRPGFYDAPAFIAVERSDPSYLNNYARFVHERARSTEYDAHVRKVVPLVTAVYYEQLKKNGRLGACIDISALISRALEQEGIWNFMVKGSLTLTFPAASRIRPQYFWSVDTNEFTAAHAWVAAPPLFVVDVAIQLQPYAGKEAKYLPRIVCEDADTLSSATLIDIVSPEVRAHFSACGIPASKQMHAANPQTPAFVATFPAREVVFEETKLKYIPVATTAPDAPFERISSMSFEGRSGYDVYMNEVRKSIVGADDA